MRIVEGLVDRRDWHSVDAMLLPGGFFRLRKAIGALGENDRRSALLAPKAAGLCAEASRLLDAQHPGAVLIIGVDADPVSRKIGGDQLVTAWQAGDLVGFARKTFPSHGDTHGKQPPYPVFDLDFASPARIVALRGGRRVLLLGCYDAFGTRSVVHSRFADLVAMRLARDRPGGWHKPSLALRRSFLTRWRALIRAHPPDLALCAIHGFKRPGMDGYWQRHGIAGASAALGGIPVIGASHFNKALPASIHRSVLAASGVPLAHLELGPHRPMQALAPHEGFTIADDDGEPVALIRRFDLALRANHGRNI
ncbi:MAG: hypothetical protein JNK84_12430 [Phreatobacter sp.]|uniref:hypothetical protein n=1 Tax=Phreatobacter sp. TaxID=1966341 RepID=UPI001A42EEB2|nr:hypothetical protein [Phreatobacter sp.]MBL8569872.1 hypothetical protein [Phreatobacter sp.]